MSVPRQQSPSQSPTPSKSSLRQTNSNRNSSQRSILPPPSPRFEDRATIEVRYSPRSPPNQTLEYDSNDEEEEEEDDDEHTQPHFEHHDASYFPIITAQELAQPFEPLFTLIEDSVTSEHYHPSIHYIFADDDQDIITEAAVRSLENNDPGESSTLGHDRSRQSGETTESRLPPSQAWVKEHYLVLEVQPVAGAPQPHIIPQTQSRSLSQAQPEDSAQQSISQPAPFVVTACTSFSADWQITSTSITSAPTMSNVPGDAEEGFMLRIAGRGLAPFGQSDAELGPKGKRSAPGEGGSSQKTETESDKETLEELIARFQSKLDKVRQLMEIDNLGGTLGNNPDAGEGTRIPHMLEHANQQQQEFDFEAQD